MKYYVVTYTEDDGWQSFHETIGVKKTLEEAKELMKQKIDYQVERNGIPLCDYDITEKENYIFYEDGAGGWWFKVKYEEIKEM